MLARRKISDEFTHTYEATVQSKFFALSHILRPLENLKCEIQNCITALNMIFCDQICVWHSKESPYRFVFPCVYILFCLVDLLLFQLKNNLEEVSHGNHHLPSGLLRLDPEEAVTILGTAVDVTKCTVVRHVLGNEADLVHRVMVQAILGTGNIKF